jgi:hypothetical protein
MGYTPMFVVAGVLGPVGLVLTVLLAGRVAPIHPPTCPPQPPRQRASNAPERST